MTLLDMTDQVVAQFYLKDSITSYRFYAFDLPFALERPEISCSANGNLVTLTAPAGYNRYLWSTGDTTQLIAVSDTGMYQVWVDKGIGMLGSPPIHLQGGGCGSVGISPPSPAESDEIIGYYTLLGQPLVRPVKGAPFVARFRSGKAKVMLIR